MPHRLTTVGAVVVALLAIPAGASAATKTVAAGPPLTKAPPGVPQYADPTAFFGPTTTIHVDDTVKWRFFGFHNVYFPKQGKGNVPLIIPDPTRQYTDVLDPAGAPFWFNGQNQFIGNPAAAFPAGGKTETGAKVNNSGLPTSEKFSYSLKFTKTGTFTYYCSIHPGMKGKVKVVSKKSSIPSVAQDKAAVAKQVAGAIAEAKKLNRGADGTGNIVNAGHDSPTMSLLNFFPDKKTVPVGTTVLFRMTPSTNEIHTITFGSPAVLAKGGYAANLSNALLSPLPGTGTNGPPVLGVPGQIAFPSDPGPLTFDGTQHGGFESSGLIGGKVFKGLPQTTQFTFTTPGTYNYVCLIHPEMRGQITVQ